MSIVASFYLIELSMIDQLVANAIPVIEKKFFSQKTIDRYEDVLQAHATRLPDLSDNDYSASIFVNVLVFLKERKGIDLTCSVFQTQAEEITGGRGISTQILTYAQWQQYHDQLNPSHFDVEEFLAFNTEFDGNDEHGWAMAGIAAIKAIHDNLSSIPGEEYVLLFDLG